MIIKFCHKFTKNFVISSKKKIKSRGAFHLLLIPLFSKNTQPSRLGRWCVLGNKYKEL